MIRTQTEYTEAVNFIDRDMELYDYDLSKKMTSYEYNLYLQDTEYYLDFLYEKTRTIEDLIEYLEHYSKNKLEQLKEEIKEKEDILEAAVDKYIDKNYVSCRINWKNGNNQVVTDRDGSSLQLATIKDNVISAGANISNQAFIKSIVRTSNQTSYSNNAEQYINNNIYLTVYNLDAPTTIEEEITVEVTDSSNVNDTSFETINCSCEFLGQTDTNKFSYKLTASNNTKEQENFNYGIYSSSNLDSVNTIDYSYNTSKDINSNQNTLAANKNLVYNSDYITSVLSSQKTKQKQKDKSGEIAIANG